MTDRSRDASTSAGAAPRSRQDWVRLLDEHGTVHGFNVPLGPRHGALFTEDDDTLLVTFESAQDIRGARTGLPFGLTVAGRDGFSHLCLYCEGETFFRDPTVYAFFDDLVDDGFFDHFDRVVFYGAGPRGQAAAAFSVAAPGASLVLVRPLATLTPATAGWDDRYPAMRRADFDSRYGPAPALIDAAGEVTVILDPRVALDAMHAALLARPGDRVLRCPDLGARPERDLAQMGILVPLLRAAGKGRLDARLFFDLYRRRRFHAPYLGRVLDRLRRQGRSGLEARWKRGIVAVSAALRDAPAPDR